METDTFTNTHQIASLSFMIEVGSTFWFKTEFNVGGQRASSAELRSINRLEREYHSTIHNTVRRTKTQSFF